MKQFSFLLAFFCLSLSACEPVDDIWTGELTAPKVTGVTLVDHNGVPLQMVGKANDRDFPDRALSLSVYPNPARYQLHVALSAPGAREADVWLTQARFDDASDFPSYFNATPVVVGGVPVLKAPKFFFQDRGTVSFQTWDLPHGVYRLYARMDGQIAWRNILVP